MSVRRCVTLKAPQCHSFLLIDFIALKATRLQERSRANKQKDKCSNILEQHEVVDDAGDTRVAFLYMFVHISHRMWKIPDISFQNAVVFQRFSLFIICKSPQTSGSSG